MIYVCDTVADISNPVEGMMAYEKTNDLIKVCTVGGATPAWGQAYPSTNADTVDNYHASTFSQNSENATYIKANYVESGSISSVGWYTTPVTYISAFPNSTKAVVPIFWNQGTGNIDVNRLRIKRDSLTASGFSIEFYVDTVGSAGTVKFFWIAMGI